MNKFEQAQGTVLENIARATRWRVELEKKTVSSDRLKSLISPNRPPLDFAQVFNDATGKAPKIIAEVKLRSPSSPNLGKGLDPLDVGLAYARNGASAVSVLTEPDFFGGSLSHLSAIRAKTTLPLLMKDFVIDPYQFAQARIAGADAVLLIAALLGPELGSMLEEASRWGLTALVEVHTEEEMKSALKAGARIIGVNNRDLKTLEVDLEVARRLAPLARGTPAVLIAESGIQTRGDIDALSAIGYRGFLIGTTFIKNGRPGEALAKILGRTPA